MRTRYTPRIALLQTELVLDNSLLSLTQLSIVGRGCKLSKGIRRLGRSGTTRAPRIHGLLLFLYSSAINDKC